MKAPPAEQRSYGSPSLSFGLSSAFTVNQTEQALVLRFGQAINIVREPGLDFGCPSSTASCASTNESSR